MAEPPETLPKQRVMVDQEGDVLAFDQTHRLRLGESGCALGCIALLAAPFLYFFSGLSRLEVAGLVGSALACNLVWAMLVKPLERYVTLDRRAGRFLERSRNRFGWKKRDLSFEEIGKIVYRVDYDVDGIEYEVHLGDPSIYKVCEVKDVESIAREAADTIAAFTGWPIDVREEDAAKYPDQKAARDARLREQQTGGEA
jgi:hypothetical protein